MLIRLPLEVTHPTVILWLLIYAPLLPGEIRSSEPRRKCCVLHAAGAQCDLVECILSEMALLVTWAPVLA